MTVFLTTAPLFFFKCITRQHMDYHTTHYTRHVAMASAREVTNHAEWQQVSPVPYCISDSDLLKFSQEESLIYYLKKMANVTTPLQKSFPDGYRQYRHAS